MYSVEPMRSEFLGAEEMRSILGIGRSAFYEAARRDDLPVPVVRVGKRLLFSRRALDAVLDRQHEDVMRQSATGQDRFSDGA